MLPRVVSVMALLADSASEGASSSMGSLVISSSWELSFPTSHLSVPRSSSLVLTLKVAWLSPLTVGLSQPSGPSSVGPLSVPSSSSLLTQGAPCIFHSQGCMTNSLSSFADAISAHKRSFMHPSMGIQSGSSLMELYASITPSRHRPHALQMSSPDSDLMQNCRGRSIFSKFTGCLGT